jgi:hypothetical protein
MTVFVTATPHRPRGYEAIVLDTRLWGEVEGYSTLGARPRTVEVGTGEEVTVPAWFEQSPTGRGVLVRGGGWVHVVPLDHVKAVLTDEWRAERRKARAKATAERAVQIQRDLAPAVYEQARTAGYDVTLTGNEFRVSVDTMRALLAAATEKDAR